MKKKRIDLTGTEILEICDKSVCNICRIKCGSYCLPINGVNIFPECWLDEEVEVEE